MAVMTVNYKVEHLGPGCLTLSFIALDSKVSLLRWIAQLSVDTSGITKTVIRIIKVALWSRDKPQFVHSLCAMVNVLSRTCHFSTLPCWGSVWLLCLLVLLCCSGSLTILDEILSASFLRTACWYSADYPQATALPPSLFTLCTLQILWLTTLS